MEKHSTEQLNAVCSQVRRDILRMVHACQSGHPGASLGCTEFFVALYFDQMKHNSSFNLDGEGEDLFFLSNGHISPVWYSVLSRSGYFDTAELKTFRKINSRLQGHPATEEGFPEFAWPPAPLVKAYPLLLVRPCPKRSMETTGWSTP